MRGRTILVVILALACGLAAFVGISMMGTGTPAAVATRPVIYAVAEIPRGAPIEKEMVEIHQVPEAVLPPAALGKPEDVLGRIAAMKMIPGDAVTDGKLEPKGARARIVPLGKLAFTVARADMPPLEVDDHVDVYFTANGQAAAIPPLQDILVWDVPSAGSKPGAANAQGPVTLLVDPRQANDLNQGMNQGNLRLVRRNPNAPVVAVPPAPVAPAPEIDVAAECGEGMRQYALENTPPSVTIGGLLRAGDYVDVILTRKGTAGAKAISRTLEDIRVSWAESGAKANPAKAPSVILCVTPDEAATIDRAAADGTIHLARRVPDDHAKLPLLVKNASADLRASINPQMRAFTFQAINPSVTLGNRIRPQDHVDVIMIIKPAKSEGMIAQTIHNLEVLNITAGEAPFDEEKQAVTLLVTPDEAMKLALAQTTGTLYLTLRKPDDLDLPGSQDTGSPLSKSPSVKPGMRAFVFEPRGAFPMLKLGDHVDLIVSGESQPRDRSESRATMTSVGNDARGSTTETTNARGELRADSSTIPNLEVIALTAANDDTGMAKPLITLQVTPSQAVDLARARSRGAIDLVVRSPGDDAIPPPPALARGKALAMAIGPGKRAFTITAPNPLTALGGLLNRGDHVDVIITPKSGGPGASSPATTLANLEVLGMPESDGHQSTVTLLVTPTQAEALSQGQLNGTLQLSLRTPGDEFVSTPPDAEFTISTKTLRGTALGADRFMIRVPSPRARVGAVPR